MTENSGGPAKTAHARPLPSLCPPFARAHCSAPFHSAPQLRGSQRSRSANRHFFLKIFRGSAANSRLHLQQRKDIFSQETNFHRKLQLFFFVCRGEPFARKQFFEENGCFKKKHDILRWKKLAKVAIFFRRPKPSPKSTFTIVFQKTKVFHNIQSEQAQTEQNVHHSKILPHGHYSST